MVKFVADSSCDMINIPNVDFQSVPLTISTDEHSWRDDENVDVHDMLTTLASYKGRSFSACPSVEDWLNSFEGADTIYAVTMTSGLSGTYNSAMAASEIYLGEHPEAKIKVFDTLSAGPAMKMMLEKLIELHNSGLGFEEVCAQAEEYLKSVNLFYVFKSLHNFAQNGRVNKALAATIGLLGIRIVGTVSDEGTIQPLAKSRGDKAALNSLTKLIAETGFNGGKIRISHTENQELAEQFADIMKKKFGVTDIEIYPARGLCSYYGEAGAIFIGIAPN